MSSRAAERVCAKKRRKMPNTFLHPEADEPIQAAALLGHLRLGLVRVCYVVKKQKRTITWRFFFSLYALIAQAYRKKANKKIPAKQSSWLDSLVAAMWFEHMTLRVWKIKIGNKRHGWRGGCEGVRTEDLCVSSPFMNTVNPWTFQLFRNSERFRSMSLFLRSWQVKDFSFIYNKLHNKMSFDIYKYSIPPLAHLFLHNVHHGQMQHFILSRYPWTLFSAHAWLFLPICYLPLSLHDLYFP